MTVSEPTERDTAETQLDPEALLRRLARLAVGFSGADIERLVREARQRARRAQRPLSYADLERLLAAARPIHAPGKRRRLAVHEAGHMLSRILLGVGTLSLATIDGVGGEIFTEAIVNDDDIETLERCEAFLQVQMAGRAAELVVYGSTLSGSGGTTRSDLARATHLATTMEASLGFGARLPLLYRDPDHWQTLLRQDDRLARRVHARIAAAERAARSLIALNRDRLDLIVDELLTQGTIEGDALQRLIGKVAADRVIARAVWD